MPRTQGQRQTSLVTRGEIVALHLRGINYSEIARNTGLSVSKKTLEL